MKTPKKQLTASEMGRLGGKATAKKGKEYMKTIGKNGATSRWNKSKSIIKK